MCFTVTLGSVAAFTRLKVGRYLEMARENGAADSAMLIETECTGTGDKNVLCDSVSD